MYIALNYIGKDITPGEVVDKLDDDILQWLLKKGAVKFVPETEMPPAQAAAPEEPAAAEDEERAEVDEADIEPPEIDAMDALVTAPAKKASRSKGGKAK